METNIGAFVFHRYIHAFICPSTKGIRETALLDTGKQNWIDGVCLIMTVGDHLEKKWDGMQNCVKLAQTNKLEGTGQDHCGVSLSSATLRQ